MRTFCGKAQVPQSFGRIAQNYAETVTFHKIYTPRNKVKLRYFTQRQVSFFNPFRAWYLYFFNTLLRILENNDVYVITGTKWGNFKESVNKENHILRHVLNSIIICNTTEKFEGICLGPSFQFNVVNLTCHENPKQWFQSNFEFSFYRWDKLNRLEILLMDSELTVIKCIKNWVEVFANKLHYMEETLFGKRKKLDLNRNFFELTVKKFGL